jgi:hypothetical protein
LSAVVAGLRTSREVTNKIRYRGDIRELPSREAMQKLLQHLQAALFPTHYGHTDHPVRPSIISSEPVECRVVHPARAGAA